MRFTHLRRQPITEGYTKSLQRQLRGEPLVEVYQEFGKLSGRLDVDIRRISTMRAFFENDEDFDPFSHLEDFEEIDPKKDCVLQLQDGADKLQHLKVVYVGLPAGYTCPFADKCRTFAHRKGKEFPLQPGQEKPMKIKQTGDIRCFAASREMQYKELRELRWRNLDLIKEFEGDPEGMVDLFLRSLDYYEYNKKKIRLFRIHDSGDFFSQEYFDAWVETAKRRPDILFYAYTTSLPFWVERIDDLPKNFRLIASKGGKRDDLIDKHDLRQAIIVMDKGEAIRRKLNIDVNEFLAIFSDKDFALLVHNTQAKGTEAARKKAENERLIKHKAEKFHLPPEELERLVRQYTTAAIRYATEE